VWNKWSTQGNLHVAKTLRYREATNDHYSVKFGDVVESTKPESKSESSKSEPESTGSQSESTDVHSKSEYRLRA